MDQTQGQLAAIEPATGATEEAPRVGGPLDALRRLGAGRLAALGLTAVALLALLGHLIFEVAGERYALLYAGLEVAEGAEIVQRLEAMNVPFRLQDDGTTIFVPADRALRLRLTLAEEGLPRGGNVGYEIFDDTSPFGTTSFLADINQRRALEGELARTITALADVRAARVHLVMPKRELFQRQQIEPSASITLRLAGGRGLSRRQVQAVQHLVAAAVPDLKPERITLVDDQGTLLARGGDEAEGGVLPGQAEEMRAAYEARLKRTIEDLLERSLGPGRARAEVTAELDLDRITTTEESFDPEGQVVRSTQLVEEESRSNEEDQNDAVTVGNNLPNAGAETEGAARTSSEDTVRNEETVNYEISRTVRHHTRVGGRVRRLSLAVLVDGRMVEDASGELIYEPREPAELERIATLVRSAVGFDETRGDVIEVVNMPFSDPPSPAVEESWLPLGMDAILRLAELAALALVALMLILLVVRPALRQLAPPLPQPALAGAGAAGGQAALSADDGTPRQLTGPGSDQAARAAPEPATPEKPERVSIEQVEGSVRADLIDSMIETIDKTPEDAVAIVRSWLNEK